MTNRHSKWRMALLASLSMILTSTMAAEHRALLADSELSTAVNKNAIKTEEGAGKTIDYSLYNYGTTGLLGTLGGSAVLSLTKKANQNLAFNDTQASTIAALGNAALILGGALLFGQLNNRIQARAQHNLYARGFKSQPLHAPMPLKKRRLRFRKRRRPAAGHRAYAQRHGHLPVGGRRRLRKNFRARPGRLQPAQQPNYLQNHRILENYPQTRDQVSVPLRDGAYSGEASVLDPIQPMLYNDPYDYDMDQHLMDDYYYDDYYNDLPDFSALKGDKKMPHPTTKSQQPTMTSSLQPPITIPNIPKKAMEMKNELYDQQQPGIRSPSRSEVLLKMSEEKRMEKLQKERAKLLEATLMNPEDMRYEEPPARPEVRDFVPEKNIRTRARVPLRRQRVQPPQPHEPMNMSDMFKDTPFQTPFARQQLNTPDRPGPDPSPPSPAQAPVEDPFYFRQSSDPFNSIASDFEVTNEDWISTISQAFEGFSDFKKLRK